MSFTPTNTFVPGTTVLGADVQKNLEDLQAYNNGGVSSADMATSAWCRQQHVVRPAYRPITSTLQCVSGSVSEAARPRDVSRYTYVQRATSERATGSQSWQFIPGTLRQIIVPRGARAMLLQYGFSGTTGPEDSTYAAGAALYGAPQATVRAFMTVAPIDSVSDLVGLSDLDSFTEHIIPPEQSSVVTTHNTIRAGKARRDHHSGFKLFTNAAPGTYTVGLAGTGSLPKLRIWRWNVVAEAWMV